MNPTKPVTEAEAAETGTILKAEAEDKAAVDEPKKEEIPATEANEATGEAEGKVAAEESKPEATEEVASETPAA